MSTRGWGPGHFDGHLWIHGANLEIQPIEIRERVRTLVERNHGTVTFAGPYKRSELGKLMAGIDWIVVPSIFEETGPLVILEAFLYGRPVICSDFGGMAEKVTNDVNGLHFKRGDSQYLAKTMLRAVETPGLWNELRKGIPSKPPRWMKDHVAVLSQLYERLLANP